MRFLFCLVLIIGCASQPEPEPEPPQCVEWSDGRVSHVMTEDDYIKPALVGNCKNCGRPYKEEK